jgi:hypothetical protein
MKTNEHKQYDEIGRLGKKTELSPNQLSPRDARPEDFEITNEGQPPFDGQCGSTAREYRQLLSEADSHGKSKLSKE